MRPSIEEQGRKLARYPGWRPLFQSEWLGVWQGPVRTPLKAYQVRIQFVRSARRGDAWITSRINPRVWVIEPDLELYPGTDRLPHAYFAEAPPAQWPLCLYFHPDQEWTEEDWIADAIVPWAGEWLVFYEGWLATGVWYGGGLHFGDEDYVTWAMSRARPGTALPAQAASCNRRAENLIGRRMGSFVSSALMAAASRGFSPPPSLRDWNLCLWQDED
ncbi:MAG: hypothetical protein A4S17_02755 [Proteobacteria bacterium HN_bin10]|nr:MAG: hypothetical protein A4S17_02755 [Proteobacteria bacterium HN_bin10]